MIFSLFIIFCLLLVFFLFLVNYLISENTYIDLTREETSSYECGFEHNSLSRIPFSVRYFLLTIVFLIFDMEIIMLMFTPYLSYISLSNFYMILVVFIFVFILFMGLFYEWVDGSLDWVM